MDIVLALVVGALGGAVIGYVLKAESVPEQSQWWWVAGAIFVMGTVLGIQMDAATGPEEFILDNWSKVGVPAFIAAGIAGLMVAGVTEEANNKRGRPPT